MAKLELTPITSLGNVSSAIAAINNNYDAIEEALENTLSRDGTLPNQMEADLDLNSYDLLNAGRVQADSILLDGMLLAPSEVAAQTFLQDGDGAVPRTIADKLRDIVSVKDFGAVGDGITDDTEAIQNAVNFGIAEMPPGVYCVSAEIVIPDGCGLVGASAFWKRRTGYVYSGAKQSVLKYIGASGTNTCVVRASATAVGVMGGDFSGPDTDDLTNILLRNFHVDANGLADYGIYVYRAGNQATLSHLTAEKAVKANHVHLGCFAAQFGVFGSYESQNEGVVCGWDIFSWGSAEATNFAYTAHFKTANNGTAGTYVAGTATDLEGSGGRFSVGRGSRVTITSEGNDGRACVLSQLNIASGTGGTTDYILEYLEGNADGPYVDYRDGMDAIRLSNGFLHPGNGSSLLPQNIKIEGKNNAGVVTANSGPARSEEWLTLYRLHGDLSGVGVAINSNTTKYKMIECGTFFTFSASRPGAYSFNLGLEGATTPGTQTYSARTGYAVRNGNVVTVTGRLTLATLDGAAAGQLRITGLPYRVASLSGMFGSVSMGAWSNLTTAVVAIHGTVAANTSYISLTKVTAAATNNLSNLVPADISGTTLLQFTATYITDD